MMIKGHNSANFHLDCNVEQDITRISALLQIGQRTGENENDRLSRTATDSLQSVKFKAIYRWVHTRHFSLGKLTTSLYFPK